MRGEEQTAVAQQNSDTASPCDLPVEPRQRLMNALALESRNALSRVELAASELGRGETRPRDQAMLATIHEAVEELDDHLGRIRALSLDAFALVADVNPQTVLGDALSQAIQRIDATLAARGVFLDVEPWTADTPRVAIPEATLTRLFFAFLRLGLGLAERGDRVRVTAALSSGAPTLSWLNESSSATPLQWEELAARRLDVESQWAEWGGRLAVDSATGALHLSFDGPHSNRSEGQS